jgi:hypothetical protein
LLRLLRGVMQLRRDRSLPPNLLLRLLLGRLLRLLRGVMQLRRDRSLRLPMVIRMLLGSFLRGVMQQLKAQLSLIWKHTN